MFENRSLFFRYQEFEMCKQILGAEVNVIAEEISYANCVQSRIFSCNLLFLANTMYFF